MLLTLLATVASMGSLAGEVARAGRIERATLENGIRVLVLPIRGSERVAVETFYEIGNLDEPPGMTQAAHLLEHLVCHAATASHAPREAMAALSALGLANAETLVDFTHYDYVVPRAELGRVLAIEAERLTSLEITADEIAIEAPRCYAEVDTVLANPQSGLLKHGLSALAQAWRHGAEEALVRHGLEDFRVEDLQRFQAMGYRPRNLLVVIVGDVEADAALALVRKHLGDLRDDDEVPRLPDVDWSKAPRRAVVRWDVPLRVVCLAYPPPDDPLERALLAARGGALFSLAQTKLAAHADAVYATNPLFGMGRMPFYAYAAAKPGADLEELEKALAREVEAEMTRPLSKSELFSLRVQIAERARAADSIDAKQLAAAEKQLAGLGWTADRARAQVLGQTAIDLGMAERTYGAEREALLERLKDVVPDDMLELCRRTFAADRRRVAILLPAEEDR